MLQKLILHSAPKLILPTEGVEAKLGLFCNGVFYSVKHLFNLQLILKLIATVFKHQNDPYFPKLKHFYTQSKRVLLPLVFHD